MIVQQTLDILGAQGAESIDHALSAFIALRCTVEALDHPAWPRVVIVRWTRVADLVTAGTQIPTGQQRLHPADPFYIETEILDHTMDVAHSADVFVGKKSVARRSAVGNE